MTEDRDQLERELTQHLSEAAGSPRGDAAARVRARVAATPQRGAWLVRLASAMRSPGWGRVAALATVAAAALLVGIYIGQVGLPIQLGPSPSPSAIGDSSPRSSADGPMQPITWQEPAEYSFVLEGCSPNPPVGTLRIWVANGVAIEFEALDERAKVYEEGWAPDLMPTIAFMVEQANNALARTKPVSAAGSLPEVVYRLDPMDGHPTYVAVDWSPEAVDDELCWSILEFNPDPSASEIPAPSDEPSSYALWERFEMTDPAPDLYGGARPSGVVAFGGGYVAVGTLSGCCAGEPSENLGVVWASADGRSWQLVDVGDSFEHASLDQVLVFGDRLVLAGTYAEPDGEGLSTQVGATWVSADGRTWQRADGDAPSMIAVAPFGLFGASEGADGVSYFTSTDGLTWSRGGKWHDLDRLAGVAATGDRVLVMGTEPGEPLEDGTPTSDVVAWTSPDGSNWTGGRAFENALATSAVAWEDGFAAIVHMYRLAADTSVVAETSVWTSADGLEWEDPGAVIGHPSETGMEVFAVGEQLVVTVECCGGDLVLVSPAWVSEDGVRWTPIRPQPAFEGSEVVITAVAETPQGLVAVGRRTASPSLHWTPLAWLASSEPMVWLQPSSEGGVEVGEEQPFEMGHCGLTSPIDFDGSLWAPEGDPLALPFDMTSGTIVLVEPDRARFVSEGGADVFLRRLEGAAAYPLCD